MAAWMCAGAALLLAVPSGVEACEHHRAGTKLAAPRSAAPGPSKVVAEKCKCGNAADCTCKKGQCECKKCGSRRSRLVDSLRRPAEPRKLPARRDASAGAFI
jgi:hypothetical protein